jgi:phosphoribosylformylglycinamidine cyclo-ligase
MALTYRDAGVDIDEGDRLVELIKPHARPTMRPEVLAGIGGFGGLFALDVAKYREPVLVSGTDGVGTKLKVAFLANRHDTIGIDLVAMCVNDVAVVGAEPLFFLDYFGTGKLSAEQGAEVVKGIAEGCRQAGCALIGGETAELPGFYAEGEYDLAGFAVGCVERSRIVDGRAVAPGDLVVGIASSGLHSNGYSLARKALLERFPLDHRFDALGGRTLADALLEPTRIYAKDVLALLEKVPVKAFAHVTGGGLPGNVPRNLPDGTRAVLEERRWPRPPVFDLVEREGGVSRDEMYRTFNMGLGLVAVVSPGDEAAAHALLAARGLASWTVGAIEKGADGEATCEVVR